MPKVKRVRDIALARNPEMSISKLHFAAEISMGAARRYWYGSSDGTDTEQAEPMTTVDLVVLDKVAKAIGVHWKDLIEDRRTLQAAAA